MSEEKKQGLARCQSTREKLESDPNYHADLAVVAICRRSG